MALKLHTTYPGRFDSPSENYPQGKWRNRSNSTAHDGGYLEEKHMNDIYGFFGALLRNAEMSPNGEVDTAKKSQFYDALVTVAKSVVGEEYRKLDDNVFNGLITIKSDGTVRGQVVATDQGLQLTQYPKDGTSQTFTFPSDGGEILTSNRVGSIVSFNTSKPQGITLVRKTSNGLVAWCMSKGEAISVKVGRGNQVTPSLPSNSENNFWEFYRTTLVNKLLVGLVFVKPLPPDGVSPSNVSPAYLGVAEGTYEEFIRLQYLPLRQDTLPLFKQIVAPDSKGNIKITFLCTPASPAELNVNIGGVTHTIDLRSPEPTLQHFYFTAGFSPKEVTFSSDINGTFNLVGFNLLDIKDKDSTPSDFYDGWAYYQDKDAYIYNLGASDYAIQSATNRLWAGSYHGGEKSLSEAIFVVGGKYLKHADLPDYIVSTTGVTILQETIIQWGTGESVKVNSATTIADNKIQLEGAFYDCDVSVMTAVVGMSTTSDEFTTAHAGRLIDTKEAGVYDFGNVNAITQYNPTNGMCVDSIFSPAPLVKTNRGLVVAQTPGAYAKVYPPFINGMRTSPVKLPDSFTFFNLKSFY